MQKFQQIFIKENIKLFSIIFGVLSVIIMFISNFELDNYISMFTIPIIFLIISYIYLIKKLALIKNKTAYYYLIPVVLMLLSYFLINISESNQLLNIIVIPITISIFLYSLINPNFKITKSVLLSFFKLFPNKLFSNLEYLNLLKKEQKNTKKVNNIIIGLSIGLPIGFILLALLSSADKYFDIFIGNIFTHIKNILSFSNLLPNLIILFAFFSILFSVFINLLRNRELSVNSNNVKSINNQAASIVLIIVNVVFCLFLISEISKLTTNFLNLPVEYTYAMYAREGFFQLLFVTIINISIIIYFIYYTKSLSENILIKRLIISLIAFSMLLILNSYYRMYLYMNVYGFTVLRLQVVLFLLMELILFIILLIKLFKKIKINEMLIYFVVIVTTYIINLYLCNQTIIDLINRMFNFNTNI